MKSLLTICTLLISTMCFAQDGIKILGEENRGLHFDIAVATPLPLNGDEVSLANVQTLFGYTKTFNLGIDLSPGLYFYGNIAVKNDEGKNWFAGPALFLKIFKAGGVGVGWKMAQERVGYQSPSKDNVSLLFGLRL